MTGKVVTPNTVVYTRTEWIAKRVYDAAQLLWRKTCSQCHVMTHRSESRTPGELPWLTESPADILTHPIFPDIPIAADPRRRLPHAKFDHQAHRGFSCVSCHEGPDQQRDKRRPATRDRNVQDVPRTGSGACRVAALRMPHLSRLGQRKKGQSDVPAPLAAKNRKLKTGYRRDGYLLTSAIMCSG